MGNARQIVDLSDRFMTCYESLLDWAFEVREAAVPSIGAANAFRTMVKLIDQPLAAFRSFVALLVGELDKVPDRIAASDEKIAINLKIEFKADKRLVRRFEREIGRAYRGL
jgi:hypothetical protein